MYIEKDKIEVNYCDGKCEVNDEKKYMLQSYSTTATKAIPIFPTFFQFQFRLQQCNFLEKWKKKNK